MKKEFTKNEMNNNKGCYSLSKLNKCSFINLPTIGIIDILNSEIPLKDKGWFLVKKTDLTIDQKKEFALLLAKSVIEIYNKKYPNDNRVSDCIDAIELFNSGKITIDELRNKRNSAADAYYAAYAADAAVAAAAEASASAAAAAADDAADAYKQKVFQVMIDFVNNN